jgi:hypothetical protein
MLLPLALATLALAAGAPTDTLWLTVGSPEVHSSRFVPHAARVRVRVGEGEGRLVSEWTNELTLGDSAGRPIHRWVTLGTQYPQNGEPLTWDLRQTFDAETMAPLSYVSTSSTGASLTLRIDGQRVTGTRITAASPAPQPVEMTIERPGFMAGASDLVPLAVGLSRGAVMVAPLWSPNMATSELRVFTVLDQVRITVEGTEVTAWKVTEHRYADRAWLADWYLLDETPYMVYGETRQADGQLRRMSEVAIPMSRP